MFTRGKRFTVRMDGIKLPLSFEPESDSSSLDLSMQASHLRRPEATSKEESAGKGRLAQDTGCPSKMCSITKILG